MSVHKRKAKSGGIVWAYQFDAPDSTPANRKRVAKSGFATKKEATTAEARERVKVERDYEASQQRNAHAPRTLGQLLQEFYVDCERRAIGLKTIERYRQFYRYIAPELLAMDLREVKPLMLHHEWQRIATRGGKGRRAGKPLSAKTVRAITGLLSSAYGRAIFWGLAESNPTTNSEPPKLIERKAVALTAQEQALLLDASTHPAVPILLELAAGLGARRGEVMALRWSDIQDGRANIGRSLSQVGSEVFFKSTKTGKYRTVTLPPSLVGVLAEHRFKQDELRAQFGVMYRADLDLIVCAPNGDPLKPNSLSATVSALCKRLKLPKGVSLHALRHTHASQLLAGGIEVTAVAARLGHSSPATTMKVYAHAISGRDDAAALVSDRMRELDSQTARKQ